MFSKDTLIDLLARAKISNTDKFLLCLAAYDEKPIQVKYIRKIAVDSGFRSASKLNISSILGRSKGLAVLSNNGWLLTQSGNTHVSDLIHEQGVSPKKITIANNLNQQIDFISDSITKEYAEEAVQCYEYGLLRAAVVLSWVGAVSLLYNFVVNNKLADFNQEASRRNTKWKLATTVDDLSRMKENDFLDVLNAISAIGKNVKQELKKCLQLRNSCGHPNTLKIGENIVAAHLETLILNVFSKFEQPNPALS